MPYFLIIRFMFSMLTWDWVVSLVMSVLICNVVGVLMVISDVAEKFISDVVVLDSLNT